MSTRASLRRFFTGTSAISGPKRSSASINADRCLFASAATVNAYASPNPPSTTIRIVCNPTGVIPKLLDPVALALISNALAHAKSTFPTFSTPSSTMAHMALSNRLPSMILNSLLVLLVIVSSTRRTILSASVNFLRFTVRLSLVASASPRSPWSSSSPSRVVSSNRADKFRFVPLLDPRDRSSTSRIDASSSPNVDAIFADKNLAASSSTTTPPPHPRPPPFAIARTVASAFVSFAPPRSIARSHRRSARASVSAFFLLPRRRLVVVVAASPAS